MFLSPPLNEPPTLSLPEKSTPHGNLPQPGVPVVWTVEHRCCESADVGADADEGVGGDVGGFHNA